MMRHSHVLAVPAASLILLLLGGASPTWAQAPGPFKPIPGGPKLALPDLVVESLALIKAECKNGKPLIRVNVTVKNVGSAATGAKNIYQLFVELSVAGGQQPGPGTKLGGPALGPGQSWTGFADLIIPLGGYYVAAQANPSHHVNESNEKNNYKALPLAIANPCVVK